MRKHYTSYILHLAPIIAAALMTASCTLSTEEWVIPEEEKGFDEPVTVENEFGTVTYQFQDDVVYVTKNLQDYLIRVEDDSILYFSSTMPRQYQPKEGMKLATGCARKLPHGLNHRVLSVENEGGILRVATTRTDIDDVYKVLKYEIDAYVSTPDISELDELDLALSDIEMEDSVATYWGIADPLPEEQKRQIRTRAGDDDEYVESNKLVDNNFLENVLFDFTFNSTNLIEFGSSLGPIFDAFLGSYERFSSPFLELPVKPFVEVSLKHTKYQKVHMAQDKEIKYEENYTDSWAETEVDALLGLEFEKAMGEKDDGQLDNEFYGTVMGLFSMRDTPEDYKIRNAFKNGAIKTGSKAIEGLKWRFPFMVGPVPCAFLLAFKVTPEISMQGAFQISTTLVEPKVRNGYLVKNGEKKVWDNEKLEDGAHFEPRGIGLSGEFKAGITATISAGFEVAATLGTTINANGELAFEAQGSVMKGSEDGKAFDGNFVVYADLWADWQVYVKPFGFDLWEETLWESPRASLFKLSYKNYPELGDIHASRPKILTEGDYASQYLYQADYDITSLGLDNPLLPFTIKKYMPGMRVYFGPIDNGNYKEMDLQMENISGFYTFADRPKIDKGKKYAFSYIGEYPDDVDQIYYVPYVYNIDEDKYYYGLDNSLSWEKRLKECIDDEVVLDDDGRVVEVGRPSIKTYRHQQVYGGTTPTSKSHETNGYINLTDKSGDSGGQSLVDPSSLREYKIYTVVDVTNGSRMREWGLKFYVFDNDGKKKLMRRKIPVNIPKSGRYTFIISFLTNWSLPPISYKEEPHLYVRAQPYFIFDDLVNLVSNSLQEETDRLSLERIQIDYEHKDETDDLIKKGGSSAWGEVQSIDIHTDSERL